MLLGVREGGRRVGAGDGARVTWFTTPRIGRARQPMESTVGEGELVDELVRSDPLNLDGFGCAMVPDGEADEVTVGESVEPPVAEAPVELGSLTEETQAPTVRSTPTLIAVPMGTRTNRMRRRGCSNNEGPPTHRRGRRRAGSQASWRGEREARPRVGAASDLFRLAVVSMRSDGGARGRTVRREPRVLPL